MLTDTSVDAGLKLRQRATQLFDNKLRSVSYGQDSNYVATFRRAEQ